MGGVARMVCAAPGAILIAALVLAAASVWVLATRFTVVNNSSDLLSDKSAAKQSYNELVNDFGTDSRFIILIKSDDVAENRKAADAIGPWLEALKPHISTVLYKIDYSKVKPHLLFTAGIDQLKKIEDQVNNEVKRSRASRKAETDGARPQFDPRRGQPKFNDSYLREKSNWKDFKPFVAQFVSILNKVSDQAEGKTALPAKKASDSNKGGETDFDTGDADDQFAQHEYFSLEGGKALLVFAYPGETRKTRLRPLATPGGKSGSTSSIFKANFPAWR